MGSNLESAMLKTLREPESSTRTERLYNKLKNLIISGELPAGYVFPNETEMCQELQVGRGTLREAYQTLATNGMITRAKTGTVVNDRETILNMAPFGIVAEFASFQDIFEFRLMLEGEGAKNAALRITDQEKEYLNNILEKSRKAKSFKELQKLDLAFHRAVMEYSHNPLLFSLFSSVCAAFERSVEKNYMRLSDTSPGMLRDAIGQHTKVYEALCVHDPDAAAKLMLLHLNTVYSESQ